MATLNEIESVLSSRKSYLESKFGVREIGIFGSYVRGAHTPGSDLDILVEFARPLGLIEFMALKYYLSDLLGLNVDLVMKRALKPRLVDGVLRDVVYV